MKLTPPKHSVFWAACITGAASVPFPFIGFSAVGWVLAFTAFLLLAAAARFRNF